jgi:ABC-type Fe3+/spermidine/putrescine transport system ATPase subunit
MVSPKTMLAQPIDLWSILAERLPAMQAIHLRIQNVSKRFGKVQALKNMTLDIPRGSFTTFLGPSGCGKTTLLRAIAGFYEVDQGEIFIGERKINDVPSHLRNAIMVFQDYALFPHMDIRENIIYGLKIKKLSDEEIERRCAKTVQYLGLEGLLQRSPGQISGGQQQRVALARALIMEPEVLLLDEPLSNLDAKLRVNIRAELRQLQKRLGITTIYVTHDQAEALALSDQVAVMNQGEIVQCGSPWEIYFHPGSTFVASFVGTANLLEGKVVESGSKRVLVEAEGNQVRLEVTERLHAAGSKVTLCMRPETIEIVEGVPEGIPNVIPGRVRNYLFEGSHLRYWVEALGREWVVDVFDPADKKIQEGSILLHLPPSKLHIIPN